MMKIRKRKEFLLTVSVPSLLGVESELLFTVLAAHAVSEQRVSEHGKLQTVGWSQTDLRVGKSVLSEWKPVLF